MHYIEHVDKKFIVALDTDLKSIEKYYNSFDAYQKNDFVIKQNMLPFPYIIFKFGREYFHYSKRDFREYLKQVIQNPTFKSNPEHLYGIIYTIKEKYYSNNVQNNMDESIESIHLTNALIKNILTEPKNEIISKPKRTKKGKK